MALTVDYSTTPFLITIPKSDLTLITGTQYQLTVDTFWLLLADFSDNEGTMPHPKLYNRTPATASTPSITEVNKDWYALQFEDGLYSVNIINGNTNIREVELKNQVSVNTNNTTGFIDPKFLEAGLFNEKVSIDVVNGVPLNATGKTGSGRLIGTLGTPVNNLADAKTIADDWGFKRIEILKSMTLSGASLDFSNGYIFMGASPVSVAVVVDTSVNITNCEFWDMQASGILDGGNVFRQCIIGSLNYVNGFIYECAIVGPVTLGGAATASIIKSWAFSGTEVEINLGGSGNSFVASDWYGDFLFTNCTGSSVSDIRSGGGHVTVDSTVSGGLFHIHGDSEVVDNSTGTAVVEDNTTTKRVDETWRDRGFDINKPAIITDTQKSAGGVVVSITDTGTSHILQRQ